MRNKDQLLFSYEKNSDVIMVKTLYLLPDSIYRAIAKAFKEAKYWEVLSE